MNLEFAEQVFPVLATLSKFYPGPPIFTNDNIIFDDRCYLYFTQNEGDSTIILRLSAKAYHWVSFSNYWVDSDLGPVQGWEIWASLEILDSPVKAILQKYSPGINDLGLDDFYCLLNELLPLFIDKRY